MIRAEHFIIAQLDDPEPNKQQQIVWRTSLEDFLGIWLGTRIPNNIGMGFLCM